MNILHITQYCHVESIGGTERYILDLLHELMLLKHENVIGWLTSKTKQVSVSSGIKVFSLPGTMMRVDPPSSDLLPILENLIDDFPPDVIHFHTFGRSEAAIARWVKEKGIPYVFTYHSPAWFCRHEDLMAFNETTPCDGEVRTFRCSACKIHERLQIIPVWFAWLATLGSVPFSLFLTCFEQSSLRRRTAFLADTFLFRRDLRIFLNNCNVVFACAEWSVPLLLRNGASQQAVRFCPQGVSREMIAISAQANCKISSKKYFTVGYVGRIVPVKGVDILVAAFHKFEAKGVRLRIYGWPDVVPENSFYDSIKNAAEEDHRIQLVPKLSMADMMKEYDAIDLLCIPSAWLETGPLVLFEALQRGAPVFGSSRVGQLELLKERGSVVEPNTIAQWYIALQNAFKAYQAGTWSVTRTRALGKERLRAMADVARDVAEGYLAACTKLNE